MEHNEFTGPELYRQAVLVLAERLQLLALRLELPEAAEMLCALHTLEDVAPLLRSKLLPYLHSPGPNYPARFNLSLAAVAVAGAVECLLLSENEAHWNTALRGVLISLAALGLGDDPVVSLCYTTPDPALLLVIGPLLADLWTERQGTA